MAVSIQEITSDHNIYVQCTLNDYDYCAEANKELDLGMYFDVYCNTGKVVPVGKAKKDYYQELNMLPHTDGNKYGIETVYAEMYKVNHELIITDWKRTQSKKLARIERVAEAEVSLYLEGGITYFVCHPSWKTKKVNIYYRYNDSEEYKLIVLESDKLSCERYLFAFLISTTKELFSYSKSSSHIKEQR